MTTLDRLIVHRADAVAPDVPAAAGLGIAVTDVALTVPLEAMPGPEGTVLVTIPRGLLKTGFERPLGQLQVTLTGGAA